MLPSLTVAENLRLGAAYRSDKTDLSRDYERVFEYFPVLKGKMSQRASLLSGREQQMLSLSRALLAAPRLLMVDEMSLGLASQLTRQLLDVVADLPRSGTGVLCVEQNTKLVLKKADYAYVLETGRVSHKGTGSSLSSDESIVHSYLGQE